jgi:hypothetical protein
MRGSCEPVPEVIPIGKGPNTYYLFTMTDCATKTTFVRLIKYKSDASAEIIKFCKFIYTQFGIKIKK